MKHYTFVDYATQGYATMVALLILFFHNDTVPHWKLLFAAHVVGIIVIHAFIRWTGRGPMSKPVDLLRHFYPVLLYTAFFVETGSLNRMFVTEYMDPLAIRWDQELFGCQPSVLFMHKLPYLLLSEIFYASYFSYYLMIGGMGFALFFRDRRQFFHYVSVVSFIFYVCYTIYLFVPIIGPRVFFREIEGYGLPDEVQALTPTEIYPDAVKVGPFYHIMVWIYHNFEAPGASLPSSHVAIAICTVFFSFRYLRPIRYPHAVLAFLLILATIYCRYHYVVDVIAGIIAAAILIPLANWLYFKFQGRDEPDSSSAGQPIRS